MATEADIAVQDRIMQVLTHLGVRRAHFAGRGTTDWEGMARSYPDAIASLTLVCPNGGDRALFEALGPRIAVVNGEGSVAESVERTSISLVTRSSLGRTSAPSGSSRVSSSSSAMGGT